MVEGDCTSPNCGDELSPANILPIILHVFECLGWPIPVDQQDSRKPPIILICSRVVDIQLEVRKINCFINQILLYAGLFHIGDTVHNRWCSSLTWLWPGVSALLLHILPSLRHFLLSIIITHPSRAVYVVSFTSLVVDCNGHFVQKLLQTVASSVVPPGCETAVVGPPQDALQNRWPSSHPPRSQY